MLIFSFLKINILLIIDAIAWKSRFALAITTTKLHIMDDTHQDFLFNNNEKQKTNIYLSISN